MKPTEQQVREWIAQIKSDSGEAYTQELCELAASWGAQQARDEADNAPSTEHCLWARNGHTPCQHTQQVQALQTTEEPELPVAVDHISDPDSFDPYDSIPVYTAAQMHAFADAKVSAGRAQESQWRTIDSAPKLDVAIDAAMKE